MHSLEEKPLVYIIFLSTVDMNDMFIAKKNSFLFSFHRYILQVLRILLAISVVVKYSYRLFKMLIMFFLNKTGLNILLSCITSTMSKRAPLCPQLTM